MTDKCKTFVARWDHAMCSTCGEEHDRPAPTPTPAPGLDLDAVEHDVDNIDEGDLSLKVGAYVVRTIEVHAPALIAEVRAARAEIVRLTAELAAARAVPADVEAVIDATNYAMDREEAADKLRTAIARAISDATAARGTVGGLLATAPNLSDDEGQYVANRIGLTYELSTDAGRGRAIKAMRAAEEIIARGPLPKGG